VKKEGRTLSHCCRNCHLNKAQVHSREPQYEIERNISELINAMIGVTLTTFILQHPRSSDIMFWWIHMEQWFAKYGSQISSKNKITSHHIT